MMTSLLRLQLVGLVAALVFIATPARAQEGFGSDHPLVLSFEHLGGVSYSRFEAEGSNDGATTTISAGVFTTQIPLVGPQSRLGLHYFAAPQISVGALLSYADNDNVTSNMAGLRVGYAASMGSSTALWLRGGIVYTRTEINAGFAKLELTNFKPGAEALFVFHPIEHFGIMVGGMFEIGVAGKAEVDASLFGSSGSQEQDYDEMEAALTVGVLADF